MGGPFCKGSFGGCQGQPSARPWHLLLRSLVLFIGSSLYLGYCLPYSLPYRPLPSTPCDSCSACLLPTVHPGNTPYISVKARRCISAVIVLSSSFSTGFLVLNHLSLPKVITPFFSFGRIKSFNFCLICLYKGF